MDTTVKTLDALRPGEHGKVLRLTLGGVLGRRLTSMGLIPGTEVVCRMKSGKSALTAIELRGSVIALRRKDAAKIAVGALC